MPSSLRTNRLGCALASLLCGATTRTRTRTRGTSMASVWGDYQDEGQGPSSSTAAASSGIRRPLPQDSSSRNQRRKKLRSAIRTGQLTFGPGRGVATSRRHGPGPYICFIRHRPLPYLPCRPWARPIGLHRGHNRLIGNYART